MVGIFLCYHVQRIKKRDSLKESRFDFQFKNPIATYFQ